MNNALKAASLEIFFCEEASIRYTLLPSALRLAHVKLMTTAQHSYRYDLGSIRAGLELSRVVSAPPPTRYDFKTRGLPRHLSLPSPA